ncbi:MAG: hypothetical protein ACLR7U_14385 [Ruthenibacterium lactatiformans]
MIEAGANEADEATMLKAIKTGDAEIQKIITFINGIVAEIGKPVEFQSMELTDLLEEVKRDYLDAFKAPWTPTTRPCATRGAPIATAGEYAEQWALRPLRN